MENPLNTRPMADWFPGFKRPFVISGPCSAETEEQVLATARGVAQCEQVQLLRAGIWKPRTRPNSFEGVGEVGLAWLKSAGREVGLPVATEVANAHHVEAALKAEIDVLWVGARTTVNPFSVQEIADVLKGVDIPVMVKNPVNPDMSLWLGALERINQAGIDRLAAIHRGFSSYEKTPYRNAPRWEIAIELMGRCPDLDVICDPSHIAGQRDLLAAVSQRALDLNMAGLMLESHPTPDEAWSDAKQQVTPAALATLLNGLVVRDSETNNAELLSQLADMRLKIDDLDENILTQISKRMSLVDEIGGYKRDNHVTILQVKRWQQIIQQRSAIGDQMGLSTDFMNQFLQLIHKESIKRQTSIMNAHTSDTKVD